MSNETTPAVERAARKLTTFGRLSPAAWERITPSERGYWIANVQEALTAALADPDDPDSLARTLFVARICGVEPSYGIDPALRLWDATPDQVRSNWRAVADLFRMMLTGSGS